MADSLDVLIEALRRLPGVGVKSASRMAIHLLRHDRAGAQLMAHALAQALERVGQCGSCNTLTEAEVCETCSDPGRDRSQLCVVETPSDQLALERTRAFQGYYFVLMGRLSPIDGVGAKDLSIDRLMARASVPEVREVILATNFTAEGEATAHVLTQLLRSRGLVVSRIARGMPLGGELEYVDLGTIAHALADRRSQS